MTDMMCRSARMSCPSLMTGADNIALEWHHDASVGKGRAEVNIVVRLKDGRRVATEAGTRSWMIDKRWNLDTIYCLYDLPHICW